MNVTEMRFDECEIPWNMYMTNYWCFFRLALIKNQVTNVHTKESWIMA